MHAHHTRTQPRSLSLALSPSPSLLSLPHIQFHMLSEGEKNERRNEYKSKQGQPKSGGGGGGSGSVGGARPPLLQDPSSRACLATTARSGSPRCRNRARRRGGRPTERFGRWHYGVPSSFDAAAAAAAATAVGMASSLGGIIIGRGQHSPSSSLHQPHQHQTQWTGLPLTVEALKTHTTDTREQERIVNPKGSAQV